MLNLTYNEMLSAYSAYPAPIRPYLLRAETHPVLREKLTKSVMRAFIDLLSRANIANSGRPIQVRMDLTAERLGISSKTVSRTIKVMKKNAWLTTSPSHDGRNWRGEYAGREFILCDALRKLVGLPTGAGTPAAPGEEKPHQDGSGSASVAPAAAPAGLQAGPAQPAPAKPLTASDDAATPSVDNPESDETKMSDGSGGCPQKTAQDSSKQTEMSDGHIGVNNCFIKKEAPFKTAALVIENESEKPIRIPADLADMYTVFGMSGKGICGLMRLAKEKCQRLQDVWKVKKEQLRKAGATGGRAVLYLRTLISCGEDFAYIARNMPSSPEETTTPPSIGACSASVSQGTSGHSPASDTADRVDPRSFVNLYDFVKKCAFKKYRHISNGMVVRFYDLTADVAQGTTYSVYAGWAMMQNLYLGVARGNLVEVTE